MIGLISGCFREFSDALTSSIFLSVNHDADTPALASTTQDIHKVALTKIDSIQNCCPTCVYQIDHFAIYIARTRQINSDNYR
jgi:hypothetical protein